MSDAALVQWLSNADVLCSRFASIPVPGSDDLVFVKLLPLTAFELQPENRHATSNARCLPTYYQHRFGGAGFGSWRELEVQRAAHQWVTSGRCESFPLLHHWRLLPIVGEPHEDTLSTARWGDNAAIAQRVEEVAGATHSIALFLESFPHTLAAWLRSRLTQEPNDVEVLRKTETALTEILRFMSDEGVLHLDAHFENILTDGERLYLGDFGLALSRSFELQPDEFAFFERHANFDRCTVVTSLVHAIVAQYDARSDWRQSLRELLDRSHPASDRLPAELRSYLEQRVPVALAIGDFYRRLLNDLTTDYPATELQTLLDDLKV